MNTDNQTPPAPAADASPALAPAPGSVSGYRDLTAGDKLQAGDEGLHEGQWVRMASAFVGYYYVPGLMPRMRRRWPCDHSAGGWQFEGDLLCRKCNAVID